MERNDCPGDIVEEPVHTFGYSDMYMLHPMFLALAQIYGRSKCFLEECFTCALERASRHGKYIGRMVVLPVYVARLYSLVAPFRPCPRHQRRRQSCLVFAKVHHVLSTRTLDSWVSCICDQPHDWPCVWRTLTDHAAVDFADIDPEWSGAIGCVLSGLQSRSTENVF